MTLVCPESVVSDGYKSGGFSFSLSWKVSFLVLVGLVQCCIVLSIIIKSFLVIHNT